MESHIEPKVIDDLLLQAQSDGIEKKVVGAVIVHKGKILLLERSLSDFMGGLVELPSGTVEEGEQLLEALEREVLEETELIIVSIVSYLGSFDYLSESGKKTRQFNFLVRVTSDEVKISQEHSAYYFITHQDIENFNISDAVKDILKI